MHEIFFLEIYVYHAKEEEDQIINYYKESIVIMTRILHHQLFWSITESRNSAFFGVNDICLICFWNFILTQNISTTKWLLPLSSIFIYCFFYAFELKKMKYEYRKIGNMNLYCTWNADDQSTDDASKSLSLNIYHWISCLPFPLLYNNSLINMFILFVTNKQNK